MITRRLSLYLSTLALSAALVGCSTQAAENAEAPGIATKLPVDVKVVHAQPLQQDEIVAGSVLPNREVAITSELSKKITDVFFQDGRVVQKEQPLYQLEDAEIIARLKQIKADLQLAQLTEQRLSALLKTETIRQEEYDGAYAKLQSLLAAEELLNIELSKTTIRAPFSGRVGITQFDEGALVAAGVQLVTLQDQDIVKIQFPVSEKYTEGLRFGRKISFSATNSSERYTATITGTDAGVDRNTRTITVYATTNNANGLLKPGMSVRIYFPTATENAVGFLLPTQALMPSGNGYSVFTVKNGVAKTTAVQIGNRTEADVLVTSGLAEGDTVMISNILRTGEGTPVQAVTAN